VHDTETFDDMFPGEIYREHAATRSREEFDHVRLFDVIDDDGIKYFRLAVPMLKDEGDAEFALESLFTGLMYDVGATSLRDVSRIGGVDWSMG
jgi:hypothetical protein